MKQAQNLARMPAPARYKADNAATFVEAFEGNAALKEGPEWLLSLRQEAADTVAEMGLPTPKLERWKYTNVHPAIKGVSGVAAKSGFVVKSVDKLVTDLSESLQNAPEWLQSILTERPHATFRYADMMMWELANMFTQDGVVIDVPAGQKASEAITIDFTGHEGQLSAPRAVIRLGEGAELTIIENHKGEGQFWNNALIQIKIADGAKLRHYRMQEYGSKAVYTQNTHVEIGEGAHYEAFTMALGANITRNQVHAAVIGGGADCDIYGINLLDGSQISDSTFEVEHMAENCNSNQFIRSVMRDQSKGIFQGKVYVHEGADGTDGYQLSNALLLSEGAEMDTKPELEIYADDVKCSHGATTGQLDEEPLFYLRSRGLSENEARALMIEAFVNEVVEKLADETVKDVVLQKVSQWLKL